MKGGPIMPVKRCNKPKNGGGKGGEAIPMQEQKQEQCSGSRK